MTDRLPECCDAAVAELTPVLYSRGIVLVRVAGFPPIVEVHAGENVLTVNGIGDGKDSWKAAIEKAADKLTAEFGELPPIDPPADPVMEQDAPVDPVDPVTPPSDPVEPEAPVEQPVSEPVVPPAEPEVAAPVTDEAPAPTPAPVEGVDGNGSPVVEPAPTE